MNIPLNKIKNTLSLLASYLLGIIIGAFVIHILEILKVKCFHIHPNAIWWELKKIHYAWMIHNFLFLIGMFCIIYFIVTICLKQCLHIYPHEHPKFYHFLKTTFISIPIFIFCVVCESKEFFFFVTSSFAFHLVYSFISSKIALFEK